MNLFLTLCEEFLSMKPLSALSSEELIKRKSTLKGILIGFMIIALIVAVLLVYICFFSNKRLPIATLIPIFSLPLTWLPVFISIKSINDEIELRKQKIA